MAIKRFSIPDASPDQINRFKEEVAILKKTRHENLALFMGASLTVPNLAIVTRYVCVRVCVCERDIEEREKIGGRVKATFLRLLYFLTKKHYVSVFLSTTFLGGVEGAMRGRAWREVEARRERFHFFFSTASVKVVPSTLTCTCGVSRLPWRRASTSVVKWLRLWATSMPGASFTKTSTQRTSSSRKTK